MALRKPNASFAKTPAHQSSSDEEDSTSSESEDGGAKFFASRPTVMKKSKWLASQGADSDSESGSESESESSSSSSSPSDDDDNDNNGEEESEKEEEKEKPTKATPSRFAKSKPVDLDDEKADKDEDKEYSDDGESSDFSFLSDSDEDTSEESSENDERLLEPEQRRSRWVKVATEEPKVEEQKKAEPKPKAEKETKKAKASAEKESKVEKQTKDRDAVAELLGDVNTNNILTKLEVVMLTRGRKGADREVILLALQHLLNIAALPFQKIKLLFSLVLFCFDYPSVSSHFLPVGQWKLAAARISEILDLLEKEPYLVLSEDVEEQDEATLVELSTKSISSGTTPGKKNDTATITLKCSLVSQIERLDDEFIKSLQNLDMKAADYRDRIRDEVNMYLVLLRSEVYLRRIQSLDALHRILLRRVEHTYYKKDKVIQALDQYFHKTDPSLTSTQLPFTSLCSYLYQHGDDRIRTRTVLCHVYHQALHGQFHKAREMLLMSQVQGVIYQADISTQALFNRALMQLGLSAFRLGLMRDCYMFLHGMLNTGHTMELFGAGCYPINQEMLETVYLTVSMFLEVPNIAGHPFDQGRRRILSKPFRKNFELLEKSAFVGPPENDTDSVLAAAKALFLGKAQLSYTYLSAIKCWKFFDEPKEILDMLHTQVKEVALITWIYNRAMNSTSICLNHLAAQFEMDITQVYSMISKMIKTKEIKGHIDGVKDVFILSRPTTKIQWMSNQLADKLIHLSELHQKIYETKPAPKKPTRTFNNANKKKNHESKERNN